MLGKLIKENDLRKVWRHEALDFTKWLSKDESLSLLGDELGIEIMLLETEASVGSFNVDILAEEDNTGRKIVIENQLETTDHDHLGKLITYAAGYDAEIIIWIVKEVREEHRQAIDWLNEHNDGSLNFFIVKLELWKIDQSPYAVNFNVVSRPNDWTKNLRETAKTANLSDTKLLQLDFWNNFREYARGQNAKLNLTKAFPQHWYEMSYGVPGSSIILTANTQNQSIGCEIYIHDSKELYNHFENQKDDIEAALGVSLEWMELPTKKASRIKVSENFDISNTLDWDSAFKWMTGTALQFQDVFLEYTDKY